MINASNGGICVEFERKTTQPWFTYFQLAGKYYNSFKINLLNILLTISVYGY